MKLVDDWKKAWKWFSTWLIGANATLVVAYEQIQTVKEYVPVNVFHYAVVGLLMLTAFGRVVKQGESNAPNQ